MRLSRTIIYAVYAILQLGKAPRGARISRSQLAASAQLPERFLLEVLHTLVARGIVRSTRGADGGFSLAREPEQISLREILEAFDYLAVPYLPTVDCQSTAVNDRILQALKNACQVAQRELQKVTVAELVGCSRAEMSRREMETSILYANGEGGIVPMSGESSLMSGSA